MRLNVYPRIILFILGICGTTAVAQHELTIETIMQGEKFTGYSPDEIQWSPAGDKIYFTWNPEQEATRSLYAVTLRNRIPVRVSPEEKKNMPSFYGDYNPDRTQMVYSRNGDIYLLDLKKGSTIQITKTSAFESNPVFSSSGDKILFTSENNLFAWSMNDGSLFQYTDFRPGMEKEEAKPYSNEDEKWLYKDQLRLFSVLAERKARREQAEKEEKAMKSPAPKVIYTGKAQTGSVSLSPDGNYITWRAFQFRDEKQTIVPNYVTESGYTEEIRARSKVGEPYYSSSDLFIYDIHRDTIYMVNKDDIPGLTDRPDYAVDYPSKKTEENKKRGIILGTPIWSDDGKEAILDIFSVDNKDRWIMLLDIKTGGLRLLNRQRDEAWVGGSGIGFRSAAGWMPDNRAIYFQSEESGFSHLYTLDVFTGKKTALTSGNYEIYNVRMSLDKKYWYFTSNEVHHGERHLYQMPLNGGEKTRLTSMEGGVEYFLSPDEKYIALRYSRANRPWELYLMENKINATPRQITESVTPEFNSYAWRTPEFIRFKADDGAEVPARLYKPEKETVNGPAVIFVHGAGYLQNAHKWWSDYYREYMFHNFLVDHGYCVLDIDYRGSAGYGRDWRTAIYRHMGGKDLDDQVDGARYLVEQCGVDPQRIGIYGGSYGGFLTLMAMFTKPEVFRAGAALRAVTDWAHYHYSYTSDILNTPVTDSLAYMRSSPIYFAEGLQGALLICHGMVDDNVHFQDVVRLAQRLIELGKENWEMAIYPVEQHGFTEPSSWIDEYKRIFKLFEENLK